MYMCVIYDIRGKIISSQLTACGGGRDTESRIHTLCLEQSNSIRDLIMNENTKALVEFFYSLRKTFPSLT